MNKYAEYKEAYKQLIIEELIKEAAIIPGTGAKGMMGKVQQTLSNYFGNLTGSRYNKLNETKNRVLTDFLKSDSVVKAVNTPTKISGMEKRLKGLADKRDLTRAYTGLGVAGGGLGLYGLNKAMTPEESGWEKLVSNFKGK